MSKLFLLNETLDTNNIKVFKEGIFELINIKRRPEHLFFKHDSVYSLSIFIDHIYPNMHGQMEQEIFKYFEQLSPYHGNYIDNEAKASAFCKSNNNGFIGIEFNHPNINLIKQVTCNNKYRTWCFNFSQDIQSLLSKTDILPDNKDGHFADHHGKNELTGFWKVLKNSQFVISAISTNFGGNEFIREVNSNGTITIVLQYTQRKYAMLVQTTGNDILETSAIASIIKDKYER